MGFLIGQVELNAAAEELLHPRTRDVIRNNWFSLDRRKTYELYWNSSRQQQLAHLTVVLYNNHEIKRIVGQWQRCKERFGALVHTAHDSFFPSDASMLSLPCTSLSQVF